MEWIDYVEDVIGIVLRATPIIIAIFLFHRRYIAPFISKIAAMSDLVTAQMVENGGGSLIDKVNRIAHVEKAVEDNHIAAETHWKGIEKNMEAIDSRVKRVEQKVVIDAD